MSSMKLVIICTVIFCAGLIGIGVFFASRDNSSRLIPVDVQYTQRVERAGWAKGANPSKVVVVEYGDFQCPTCAAEYGIINEAIEQTKDIAQLIYRNFPLPQHNKAIQAAVGAEAAGRQGKYWEMHDLLYARQSAWQDEPTLTFNSVLATYAGDLGLNVEQYKRDLKDNSLKTEIDKDVALGNIVPVQATPTIVINNQVLNRPPKDTAELVQLIKDAAAHVPAS